MLLKHILLFGENGSESDIKFSFETRCITKLFERLLVGFQSEDCKQINFHCGNFDRFKISESVDGFYEVLVPLDIKEFLKLDDFIKKEKTLELLKNCLDFVIEQKKWDPDPFQQVYLKIKKLNYINEFIWNKPKWNPSKKYKAEVHCTHDLYSFDINISITNRDNNVLKNEKILSTKPDDIIYSRFLGELKWISNGEVALFEKFSKRYVSIKLDNM
jgi:hypothetical protein